MLFFLTFSMTPALAEHWSSLYVQAIDDLEAGRWEPAIARLEKAVQQNPQSGQTMRIGVTRTVTYFPYFLLGKAQFHLGKYEDALSAFEKESSTKPPEKIAAEIAAYETSIRAAQEARRIEQFNEALSNAEAAKGRNAFREAAEELDRARGIHENEFRRRGLEALLSRVLESEKELQEKDRIAEQFQAMIERASDNERQGELRAAGVALQEAEGLIPGSPEVDRLRASIRKREEQYESLRQGASHDLRASRLADALGKLRQAMEAHPEKSKVDEVPEVADAIARQLEIRALLRQADEALDERDYRRAVENYDLVLQKDPRNITATALKPRAQSLEYLSRGEELANQRAFEESLTTFRLALKTNPENGESIFDLMRPHVDELADAGGKRLQERWLEVMQAADPGRFAEERLRPRQAATPNQTTGRRQPHRRASAGPDPVRERPDSVDKAASFALYGRPQEAIKILDSVRTTQPSGNAELESSTGIAYARLSLLTPDAGESEKHRATAREHFRRALSVNPKHKLNSRLVSPQIVKLFEEVRTER